LFSVLAFIDALIVLGDAVGGAGAYALGFALVGVILVMSVVFLVPYRRRLKRAIERAEANSPGFQPPPSQYPPPPGYQPQSQYPPPPPSQYPPPPPGGSPW
jgi:hypothetical protein